MTDMPMQNIEAEQSVLGGLLLDAGAWSRVSWLAPEDFARHDHQRVFEAIRQLPTGTPPDIITVADQLGAELEEVGGQGYLVTLVNQTPTSANIAHYAQLVRDKAVLRRVIQVAGEVVEVARSGEPAAEVVDQAERRFLEVSRGYQGSDEGYVGILPSLRETVAQLTEAHQARQEGRTIGLETGVTAFDNYFGGLHRGDLIIVAGRPSMGKSALAHTWGRHIAEAAGIVGFHSAEQPRQQILHRWLAQLAKVPVDRFRTANFTEDQWSHVTRAMERIKGLDRRLYIHDQSAMRPGAIARHARRMKADQGLDLVVVDYLQNLQADERRDSRRLELEEMSRSFKDLAKELDVPVVAISQLSRACEQRNDKRPLMSDLREAGGLEQDADLIVFPYRPAYYGEDAPPGMAELRVVKNRQGPTGFVECAFVEEQTLFADLERRQDENR